MSALHEWIADALASLFPTFQSLAKELQTDQAAIAATMTLPWSNGPVEGQIHRLKLLKRQGYGRVKIDLLKRRLLAS